MARKIVAAIGLFIFVAVVIVAVEGMSTVTKDVIGIMITVGIMMPLAALGFAVYRTTIDNATPRPPRIRHYDPWDTPRQPIIDVEWTETIGELQSSNNEIQIRR